MFDEECLIHGGPRRTKERLRARSPVVPRAVAEAVLEEAQALLGEPLPVSWVQRLSRKAETVCSYNAQFRRRIHGQGEAGREWLWSFTRHWFAAILRRERPELFLRLPSSYALGKSVPSRSLSYRTPIRPYA